MGVKKFVYLEESVDRAGCVLLQRCRPVLHYIVLLVVLHSSSTTSLVIYMYVTRPGRKQIIAGCFSVMGWFITLQAYSKSTADQSNACGVLMCPAGACGLRDAPLLRFVRGGHMYIMPAEACSTRLCRSTGVVVDILAFFSRPFLGNQGPSRNYLNTLELQ